MSFEPIESGFIHAIRRLTVNGSHIIAGFSGGADSSALLHLLNRYSVLCSFSISAIHINHMIRGEEAERDMRFCETVCRQLGIEYKVLRIDVPKYAEEAGIGIEEAARNCRYRAFEEYSRELAARFDKIYIATAHNADDNAETVLFNFTRGTGIAGLCGIPEVRNNIIRPLLFASKSEITDYCRANGIEYIMDSTNADTSYFRNRIRHNVISELKTINPILTKTVYSMTNRLSDDRNYLEHAAKKQYDNFKKSGKLDGDSLDPAILPRIVMLEAKRAGLDELSALQIDAIVKLCHSGGAHMRYILKHGYAAFYDRGKFEISRSSQSGDAPTDYELLLDYGIYELPCGIVARFQCCADSDIDKFKKLYPNFKMAKIKLAEICGPICVRTRRQGDIYSLNFVNRKVKKLFSEAVSLKDRPLYPLFSDKKGILWIPGFNSRSYSYPSDNDESDVLFFVNNIDYGGQNNEQGH